MPWAIIAPYNHNFGLRFAELFSTAAARIKAYAEDIQQRGGSLSARVDGDITVEHLTQVKEKTILGTEYRRAQDDLRHLSKLKKAVDSRSHARPHAAAAAARTPVAPVSQASSSAPQAAASIEQVAVTPGASLGGYTDPGQFQEETRIRSVEESIRGWVRAAEERCRHIVPMKFGNFLLSQPEADAYCAEFHQEKSFRGDNARVLVRMVAIMARIQAESEELRQRQNSTHLWRPHAEALALLQQAAAQANQNALAVAEVATQRGLAEKAKILHATMERLRTRVGQTRESLAFGYHPEMTLK